MGKKNVGRDVQPYKKLTTREMIREMRDLLQHTTQGTWGRGGTSHDTVALRPDGTAYHIAKFHHAIDALFVDVAHMYMGDILDDLERRLDPDALVGFTSTPEQDACPHSKYHYPLPYSNEETGVVHCLTLEDIKSMIELRTFDETFKVYTDLLDQMSN